MICFQNGDQQKVLGNSNPCQNGLT